MRAGSFEAVEVTHMAASRVLELVDPTTLARIRSRDASPVLRVFSIGHEGEARGIVSGIGQSVVRYGAEAIRSMYSKLSEGVKVFRGHGTTNDHTGRRVIGEVVGKALESIGGKLHSLAVVYVNPESRSVPLDCASIEGEVLLERDSGNTLNAVDVGSVTGIALGTSGIDTPGFDGARMLAEVACMTPDYTDPAQNDLIPSGEAYASSAAPDYTDPAQNDLIVSSHSAFLKGAEENDLIPSHGLR